MQLAWTRYTFLTRPAWLSVLDQTFLGLKIFVEEFFWRRLRLRRNPRALSVARYPLKSVARHPLTNFVQSWLNYLQKCLKSRCHCHSQSRLNCYCRSLSEWQFLASCDLLHASLETQLSVSIVFLTEIKTKLGLQFLQSNNFVGLQAFERENTYFSYALHRLIWASTWWAKKSYTS